MSSTATICTVRLSPLPRPVGFRDDGARRFVQAALRAADRGGHEPAIDVLVDAVGGQHEDVASLDLERAVVDLDLRVEADRPAEIALLPGHPHAVILRELLERGTGQPVDPGVPDVENVGGRRLEHQGGEGADVAAILVVAVGAVVRSRVQPGVRRAEHPLDRPLHRPGLRRAVIVVEEAQDGEFGRHLAHLARADAVGERDRDALGLEQQVRRRAEAVEILVHRLASLFRVLPDRNAQLRL
jgi:hypothetical protein